jgi:hypothetical protein
LLSAPDRPALKRSKHYGSECFTARFDARGMLDALFKLGHITKYAKGKIDPAAAIDNAWNAVWELDGRVVFGDEE